MPCLKPFHLADTCTYRHKGIALPLLCMCVWGNNRAMVSCSALLPSALARGSESRIYSHKIRMYVRTYVRTWRVTLRNVTRNVITYHRQGLGVGHMCVTQSDTFRYARLRRSLAIETKVGDDGAAGPSRLGYYKHQTASFSYSKRNMCHARLTCTRMYDTRTGARQRRACVFLVHYTSASLYFSLTAPLSVFCSVCPVHIVKLRYKLNFFSLVWAYCNEYMELLGLATGSVCP